jgi:SAM-dependent methyltransferase
MSSKAEETVKNFYDRFGWKAQESCESGEELLFRKFSKAYHEIYAPVSEGRVRRLFEGYTGRLLIVGPGDLPKNHITIIQQFSTTTCMDISTRALDIARQKLGDQAEYILDSIVDTALDSDQFNAAFCAHVLYHIDATEQEQAVRQMVRLVKPGGRVVIIYANPHIPKLVFKVLRPIKRFALKIVQAKNRNTSPAIPKLYYHAYRLGWWKRFSDVCEVSLLPWEVIGTRPARLLWNEVVARKFYRAALWIERTFPAVSVKLWSYPIIVLDKR